MERGEVRLNAALVTIPFLRVEGDTEPALYALRAQPDRLAQLVRSARRTYSVLGLRVTDRLTKPWAAKGVSPYTGAVAQVDRALGHPGAFALNYSYEWGCTTGIREAQDGGPILLRTLDWPLREMGRTLIAMEQRGPAGSFINITWPGFVGVLTAMASGRFAAAINQPPLPLSNAGMIGGWIASRMSVKRSRAMPPTHLLRLAFETCADFDSALKLLSEMPICVPVIYTLAGTRAGQSVIIERTENQASVLIQPYAANHWVSDIRNGTPREKSSRPRFAAMRALLADGSAPANPWSFDWLHPPILQSDTRLAFVADPSEGRIAVQGWENGTRATETFVFVANGE